MGNFTHFSFLDKGQSAVFHGQLVDTAAQTEKMPGILINSCVFII
jgi:hypothetical protein